MVWYGLGNHDFIELLCSCNTPFALPLPSCKNKIECQKITKERSEIELMWLNLRRWHPLRWFSNASMRVAWEYLGDMFLLAVILLLHYHRKRKLSKVNKFSRGVSRRDLRVPPWKFYGTDRDDMSQYIQVNILIDWWSQGCIAVRRNQAKLNLMIIIMILTWP